MSVPCPTGPPGQRCARPHSRRQLVAGPDWRHRRRAGATADRAATARVALAMAPTTTPRAGAPA